MRTTIVGAGPAGLYLAILLKKACASHEITVLERNAPDATFGWGVVFSEETLGELRDADYPTYLDITDSFARWAGIDIRYRGRLVHCGGHAFSAIKRTRLLDILQHRCRELGVELHFETEVDAHADPRLTDADLVVAADGANSLLRKADASAFGTTVRPQGGKYVWFGTDLVFDAFTFIFRETDAGLFQVHAYPFDEHTSTFIVECPERTWRAAGLDAMSEQESLEFCQNLFTAELAGHRLLSNRSIWLDFPLVRNKNWFHGNVVLLGDAAHTAHFTIGSGTKLAMEDAIALANALPQRRNGDGDLRAALVAYELARQPVVERFQQAAGDSADYFHRVGNHTGFEPIQFAYNLLTRSGRISHANLTQRDPNFVRVMDAWFAGAATESGAVPAGTIAPPPVFAPLRVGGLTIRNRVVRDLARLSERDAADTADAAVAVARAGAGLVLTEPVAVRLDGRITADDRCLHTDEQAQWWTQLVDKVHATGALLGIRLGHAGARGATRTAAVDIPLPHGEAWPLLAASAVRYGPFSQPPKEADDTDLDELLAAFRAASSRAAAAGFDSLELDLAHGRLLAGFLSPLTNRRTDGYGGSDEARLRFPLSVVDAVRAVWPADRLLAARLTVTDWAPRGLTVDSGVHIARALAQHGVELIHVTAGQTVAESRPEYRRGYLTTLSDRVRSEAGVPTLVGGYLTTPDEMNTILAAGRADLCLLDPPHTELDRVVFGR